MYDFPIKVTVTALSYVLSFPDTTRRQQEFGVTLEIYIRRKNIQREGIGMLNFRFGHRKSS